MRFPRATLIRAALAASALLAGVAAPSAAGRDLGFLRLRDVPGLRAEVTFRDAIGASLGRGPRLPRRAVSVLVGFERGVGACSHQDCGDARATPSVSWPPALPFLFAVEAGPGLPRIRPVSRRRGPGEFLRDRRGRAYVSNPARVALSGGRRATADCPAAGTCVVRIPLWPGARAWFLADDPRDSGAQVLAVDAFARDAVLPPRGASAHY